MADEVDGDVVGDYRPGSIKRIKLKNFLTHGDVEFCPGPRLNMVVGANGTGKSTILNAICLGLGGEPKLLGRADDLRAFIMHGKDEASIEIELAALPNEEPHILQRTIDRNKGSENGRGRGASTFYVNGEKTNIQAVREIVRGKYNIQIDNLCTFLPQDKVGNFSRFTDQERLLETEKTLPTNQFFFKRHMELIEKEQEIDSDVSNVESIKDTLKKKKHEFDRLEVGRAREEERATAEAQVDLLEKKKVWLEFEKLRGDAVDLKKEKEVMKVAIKAARAEIAPWEEKQQRLESLKKELEAKNKSLDQNTQKAMKEMEKQSTKCEKHDDEMENTIAQLYELDSKRERLTKGLEEAKAKLQQLEEQFATFPAREQLEQEYTDAKESTRNARKEYEAAKRDDRSLKQKFGELEENAGLLQNKLAKMNDDGARRRENVLRQAANLSKICEWLDKNRGKFRRPVWGPIAVEVTTKSQNTASYLEFHVPNNILKSFVVETNEDRELLYSEIREKLGIPINILNVAGKQLETSRIYSEEKMNILKREHGIACYLDQTFTAPDPVMVALQNFASVHKVLVGGEATQESIDRKKLRDYLAEPDAALHQTGLQRSCIFAAKGDRSYRYTQTVSSYSGKSGSRVDQVGAARMLAPGVPEEQKKRVEDELSRVHDEIAELRPTVLQAEKNANELEVKTQERHLNAAAIKQTLENIFRFQGKRDRQKRKVEESESELQSDETQEKKDLVKSLLKRLAHSVAALSAHGEQHSLMMKHTTMSAGVTVNRTAVNTAERLAREAVAEKKQAYGKLEESGHKLNQTFNTVKKLLHAKKQEAEAIAPLVDEDGNDLPLKAQLESLEVSDFNEADIALEEAKKLLNQYDANPEVIRQYEKLKDEIELIERKLADCTSTREKGLSVLTEQRKDWETRLEKYIDKINALFTLYMSEMGCTGEVCLTKGPASENGEEVTSNFKHWGLEIRVSFREGCKAEVLSAERHSGGERSVSTILYLMALQDLMVAPFRCVDEINQGLDERNERLIFKRIVANSCRAPTSSLTDHSGQYFLITPKLLPNLTDMEEEAMTLLFVFNGPFNFKSPTEWDDFVKMQETPAVAIEAANDDENSDNIPRRKSKKSRLTDD